MTGQVWGRLGRRGWWLWLLAVLVVSVVDPLLIHARDGPRPATPDTPVGDGRDEGGRFSLGLTPEVLEAHEDETGGLFTLGIVDPAQGERVRDSDQTRSPLELTLSTETADGRSALPGLGPDFFERLAEQRWPDGVTRMEKGIAAGQARIMEGGAVGLFGDDATAMRVIDFVALGKWAKDWWRSRRAKRSPDGASAPRDGFLTLVVEDVDGGPPGSISVLPLSEGWVGDAVHAGCDGQGRCRVEGLPSAAITLLVRGTGATIVGRHQTVDELSVKLRPTGRLRIVVPQESGSSGKKVRLIDAASGLVVPIIRWFNPDGGEWIRLEGTGVTLYLPEGVFTIQSDEESSGVEHSVEVSAGETAVVRLS